MALTETDLWAIGYRVKPGQYLDRPLTHAERQHIYRLRKSGELPAYPRLAAGLLANGHFVRETGCIEWTRARNAKGYGRRRVKGQLRYVHREALEMKLGRPIAPGMVARHTCDNPPCFNPLHLIEGTSDDNERDKHEHGVYFKRRGGSES